MSISCDAIGEDDSDSFVRWTNGQLEHSFLRPLDYCIRPIEDKGTLANSLASSNIDLFDRTSNLSNTLTQKIGMVARVAFLTLVTPFVALSGTYYHGFMTLKHKIFYLMGRGDVHQKQMEKHKGNFLSDFGASLPLLLGLGLVANVTHSIGVNILVGFFASRPVDFLISLSRVRGTWDITSKDRVGFYKSCFLRDHFGIVGPKGELLKWGSETEEEDIRVGWREYYLKGHFGKLYEAQALKILELIQEIQNSLPESVKMPSIYPPHSVPILDFLKKNGLPTQEWEKRFKTLETNMRLTWEIIEKGFSNSSQSFMYTIKQSFPYSEKFCNQHLKK